MLHRLFPSVRLSHCDKFYLFTKSYNANLFIFSNLCPSGKVNVKKNIKNLKSLVLNSQVYLSKFA